MSPIVCPPNCPHCPRNGVCRACGGEPKPAGHVCKHTLLERHEGNLPLDAIAVGRTLTPTIPMEPLMAPRDKFRFKGYVELEGRDGVAELLERIAKQIRETGVIDIILP